MPNDTTYDPGHPFRATSHFGNRLRRNGTTANHSGVDYGAPEGTAIPAASEGQVVFSNKNPGGYGYTVIIEHKNRHGNPIYTLYAHMKEGTILPFGTTVKAGDTVGEVGTSTGDDNNPVSPHLHFEVLWPDGYDSKGAYFGRTKERLNAGEKAIQIGLSGGIGRADPEKYNGFGSAVFGKGHPNHRSKGDENVFSFAREAEKARRASNSEHHPSSFRHPGDHSSEYGTLERHGDEVTRVEPDGSTRGSFHSE